MILLLVTQDTITGQNSIVIFTCSSSTYASKKRSPDPHGILNLCLKSKDTKILVNAWAIGRGKETWEDALSCKPKRFLDSNLAVAALVQHLKPQHKISVQNEKGDMTETMGTAARLLKPLKAVPNRNTHDHT